jgi:hypothetical protein
MSFGVWGLSYGRSYSQAQDHKKQTSDSKITRIFHLDKIQENSRLHARAALRPAESLKRLSDTRMCGKTIDLGKW